MQSATCKATRIMAQEQPWMCGAPTLTCQVNLACHRCGYWQAPSIVTSTVLRQAGKYVALFTQFLVGPYPQDLISLILHIYSGSNFVLFRNFANHKDHVRISRQWAQRVMSFHEFPCFHVSHQTTTLNRCLPTIHGYGKFNFLFLYFIVARYKSIELGVSIETT